MGIALSDSVVNGCLGGVAEVGEKTKRERPSGLNRLIICKLVLTKFILVYNIVFQREKM